IKIGNKRIGIKMDWSAGKQAALATTKLLKLLREVNDEVERNMFEYLSLKNMNDIEKARGNILRIKKINQQIDENLTSEKAKSLIYEIKILYEQLQQLLKNDRKKKDTSIYFDWLNTKG